jgi:transposase
MLPHTVSSRKPATDAPGADAPGLAEPPVTAIGVGLDTSRYGHYAAFLTADLQTAAPDLEVVESAAGYGKLRQRLHDLVSKHGRVHFHVRLDAAGQYADNLIAFLERLRAPSAGSDPRQAGAAPLALTLSVGDSQRNKNYRAAVYGPQKSDAVEAHACARYALTERPQPTALIPAPLRQLRLIAGRLQAVVRQRTRLVNQLHHLLARTFPELALLITDITTGWVLELLTRYPTATLLAAAPEEDLRAIAYLPHTRVEALLARARDSVASFDSPAAQDLVRDQVRQLRDASARQKRLEHLLVQAYRDLPTPNHVDTIPGFGQVTAAVLTAFILDIDHFDTPGKLVAYFGVLPIEASSGFQRDGTPRAPKRFVMSRRGNDLVRRYLWMAALSAAQHNPACRALYARVVAKHPSQKAIAIGHVMRKLLHLAYAIWKTGRPFDPKYYPWHAPAHVAPAAAAATLVDGSKDGEVPAAGHNPETEPERSVVTATGTASVAAADQASDGQPAGVWLDFAHLKAQLPIGRLLDHLGLTARLRGAGPQRRCACPIHRGDGRGRTFSANLADNVYQCFDASCRSKGDVIDLWAAVHHLTVRAAALDLVHTFDLEPAPSKPAGTGKRNG